MNEEDKTGMEVNQNTNSNEWDLISILMNFLFPFSSPGILILILELGK